MLRIWVVLLCAAIFLASITLLQQMRPLVHQIAQGMLGENWYRITLNTDHVGYMYNHTHTDSEGNWHFRSTTHFQLQDNAPNTISKHLVFAAHPPYDLIQATYNNRSQTQNHTTQIARNSHALEATLLRDRDQTTVPLDWQYALTDFLSFEMWLAQTTPSPGEEHITANPDFERLRVITRPYRVVENNPQGYLVETNAMLAATQTQLDQQYRPLALSMAGIFDVTRSDEAQAIALTQLKRKTSYLFPLDQRLDRHTQISRLKLKVQGVEAFDLPTQLNLKHNPVTSRGNGDSYRGEELLYPVTHPEIQRLVQQSLAAARISDAGEPADDAAISALVNVAHESLTYTENTPAGAVLTALAEGRGECTDFADLFTTLARAAGFAARTVYGLAYKDGQQPAFMFHAWNEVLVNSRWRAVDATWNQTTVDATHIPLTASQAAQMMLANTTGAVNFQVETVRYF